MYCILKVANPSCIKNGIGTAPRCSFRAVGAMTLAPAVAWEEEEMLGVEEAQVMVAAFLEVDTLVEAMVEVEIAEVVLEAEVETAEASESERQVAPVFYPEANSD